MRKTLPILRRCINFHTGFGSSLSFSEVPLAAAAAVPAGMGQADVANGHAHISFPLSANNINPKVKEAQYAVRGEIVARAKEIENDLKKGKKLPFDQVIYCNIGNPQQLGQVPITFFRQVLAICDYPNMLEFDNIEKIFPPDVIKRAKEYLDSIPGGTGAYSDSQGAPILREQIAKGIERRDGGVKADPAELFLTNGASQAVHFLMRMLIRDESDALLVPIPQYPLYSATSALYGGTLLPYFLNEGSAWELDISNLKGQIKHANKEGKVVRGLVVINPGNPTGAVLSHQNQIDVVKFCKEEGLVLMADEVYQDNVYSKDKSFVSFKKVLRDLGEEYSDVILVSFHSISKGFYGECGRRGGYMELVNLPKDVFAELVKLASIDLCSNLNGQICTALMMNPPQEGDPSYDLYAKERKDLLASLQRRASQLYKVLNELEGISCNEPQGALYCMPRIRLSKKVIQEAEKIGKAPDFLYCKELLDNTGIVTVPGSGFRQVEGTFHFRTTFLPSEKDIVAVCDRLKKFHKEFLERYGAPEA